MQHFFSLSPNWPHTLRRRLSALLACGAALTVAGCATHTAYEQPWQADGGPGYGHGYGHYHRHHPDYRHYGAGPWYEPGPWPRHRYYGHDDGYWPRHPPLPGYAPPGYYRPDAPPPRARIQDNEAQARKRERMRQLLEQPFHERDERTAPAPRRLEPDFP
ncbi:hypothetical protein EBQ26_07445 [Allofranklinella schreckenbergeri]|uniref:Uncharacterized protein n=1 Tax=Allofranklinella schreckenbergeri TaxID=1076744 RepID=A0A3M6Q604_9BURK|nr:hypothetical protein [Allofranklinella schreckenbergeri]RMW97851.1 hypothetical protein EBQ26_07445 [Allofranklinella schreckenbergeri]